MTLPVRRTLVAPVLIALLLGAERTAKADVIFSNFGRADAYDAFQAWKLGYISDFNLLRHVAVLFRVGSRPVTLDRVDVAMGFSSSPNLVDLEILPNVKGAPGPDSQALESFHLVNTLPPFGSNGPPLMVDSILHPLLEPNTSYWLAAIASRPTEDMWNNNSVGDMGTYALRDNNTPWIALLGPERPAFRVLASPVAEPATLGLLGLGLLSLVANGYRRRMRRIAKPGALESYAGTPTVP
jgi:hypothetical protein